VIKKRKRHKEQLADRAEVLLHRTCQNGHPFRRAKPAAAEKNTH